MKNNVNARRKFITSVAFGTVGFSMPVFSKNNQDFNHKKIIKDDLFYRYPSLDDELVSEVVGKSHFNFERVKELVNKRPELARATWDWNFGDFESALGAASHVGRRDIAEFLMSKGARANIFTFATFGKYELVKAMIEASPGIQQVAGPHGFSLLHHVRVGLRMKDKLTQNQIDDSKKLIDYLGSLADADGTEKYLEMDDADKEKYVGDYKYGEGEKEGFTVQLNMRKMLSLGKLGDFGGALFMLGENRFRYNGAPSVEISFLVENDKVKSLTVHEPEFVLTAKKVS